MEMEKYFDPGPAWFLTPENILPPAPAGFLAPTPSLSMRVNPGLTPAPGRPWFMYIRVEKRKLMYIG